MVGDLSVYSLYTRQSGGTRIDNSLLHETCSPCRHILQAQVGRGHAELGLAEALGFRR